MSLFNHKYKFILPAMLILIFSLLSIPAYAGGVKIIIDGFDGHSNHHFSGHNRHYRSYDRPLRHRLYNKHYFDNRAGYRTRYGNKFKNRSYGNRSYGYGDDSYYIRRNYYRNNRSYCPY